MAWNSGNRINVKHGTILKIRIREEVTRGKWVTVKKEECPVEILGGAHVVESYLLPYETRNRRRMEWDVKDSDDILADGEFCDCDRCIEKYGSVAEGSPS